MSLYFKEDWADAQDMLTGWWNHKVNNRWALGFITPRATPLNCEPSVPFSEDLKERWLDYKTVNQNKEAFFAKHCSRDASSFRAQPISGRAV